MRAAGRAWAIIALSAMRARAQEPERLTAHVEWTQSPGGSQCISQSALERAVNERWGREVFVADGNADVLVVGHVGPNPQGPGWKAVIELRSSSGADLGSRELKTEAGHCSALDDSVALAVGLMLDVSKQRLREQSEAKTRPPAPAAPPPPPPAPIELPRETLAPREPWHVDASAGGVAALGLLPGIALGLQAGVTLTPPQFFVIELGAAVWREEEARRADGGSVFDLWTTSLAVCPVKLHALDFTVCGVQRFGLVTSTGFDFAQNQEQSDAIFDVGLRARATLLRAGAFGLRLGFNAEVPVLGYHFVFVDALGRERTLYEMAPVVLLADLAAVVYF
jgi:hypothetical protein